MKKLFYYSAVMTAAMLFFGSCNKPEPEVPAEPEAPVLEITADGDFYVDSEGGAYSVDYKIDGEVDGGTVSAVCPAEWVSSLDWSTPGTVKFTAGINEAEKSRTAVLTVMYDYGEGLSVKDSVNIVQAAAEIVEPSYDYELNATIQSGSYYGDMFGVGACNWMLYLSDKPVNYGYVDAGGTLYQFDIYCPAPDDSGNPALPVGEYTLGEYGVTEAFTIAPGYTSGQKVGEDGETLDWSAHFTEGKLTVTQDGSSYEIVADMIDEEGKSHHIVYTGSVAFENLGGESSDYDVIEEDLNVTATSVSASYSSHEDDVMYVTLQFTDMPVSGGYVTPPGTMFQICAYMPFEESGKVSAGTYEVSPAVEAEFTIVSGYMLDIYGMLMPMGSYAQYFFDNENLAYGFITSGTMTVSENGQDAVSVECTFVTEEGVTLTCSYSGALKVSGMPGPFSTLTEDYTLDLSNAVGSADYYGDFFGTGGGNWDISLSPADGVTGDGLNVELVCEGLDFSAGIPSGTYKASASDTPAPNEYLVGYKSGTTLGGTLFMSGYNEEGYVNQFAPATEGDLVIVNNGDGTYQLTFSFLDDLGHTWDGTWSGTITADNYDFSSQSKAVKQKAVENFTVR